MPFEKEQRSQQQISDMGRASSRTAYFDEEKAFIDGTVSSAGASRRHNVLVEKDIASKFDLKLGETATIKKGVGKYVQQIKLDDGIYELDYQKDNLPKAFTHGNVVNNLTTENHTIEFDGSTDQIKISDGSGYLRVVLGKIGTTGNYGLKINNISGNELFGLYGTTANIAGWTVDTDHLLSADGFTNINSDGHIVLGNPSTTDVLKLSGVADDDYRIWVGNINDTLAPFRVHKDGSFYSVQGTIGGWSIGETILKSDNGYGSRIQLDRGENRVSIFDGSNTEKVAMGYLDELLKSNGIKVGTTTYAAGPPGVMTDPGRTEAAENTWEVNELVDLFIEPVGKTRVQILSNTINTVTVAAWVGGTPSTNDDFRIEFGSQDYGFWVLPGDRLRIDGDVTYEGGDWLIQHDASLKIVNGAGLEVLRLGTDTGEKGLFLYDGSAGGGYPAPSNTLAKFHTTGIQLGPTATEYMAIAVGSITMYDGGSVRSEWKDGYLSLGGAIAATDDCIIIKATEGVKIYDNSTDFLNLSTSGLAIHAGDASNAVASFGTTTYIGLQSTEHLKLTGSSMEFKDGPSTVMMSLSTASGGTLTMGGKIIINSAGTDNVCIGTGNVDLGSRNISIGIDAGAAITASANDNIFIGFEAGKLFETSTYENNIAIGSYAFATATGEQINGFGVGDDGTWQCIALGHRALQFLEEGQHCVAIGYGAMAGNAADEFTGCIFSVALGGGAMQNVVTEDGHWIENTTAIGHRTLESLTSSDSGQSKWNTALGTLAGSTLTMGWSNTLIGHGAQCSATSSVAGQVVVCAKDSVGKGNNTGFINPGSGGGGSVYQGDNASTWSQTSDRRIKKNIVDSTKGLAEITQIQVRNFEYRLPEEVDEELPSHAAVKKEGVQVGVIAQEVMNILPDIVKVEDTGAYSVSADNITWHLVKAIQELSAKVEALEASL